MQNKNIIKLLIAISLVALFSLLGKVQTARAVTAPYKCPDLNVDKKIDLLDLVIVSNNYNTCVGDAKYDARGDVNGDNCLNDTDLNFLQKYYGKLLKDVEECFMCPDLNGDNKIDLMDLIVVSNGYGACTGSTKYDARGDFNSDGCLNDIDLKYIQKYYGKLLSAVGQCGGIPPTTTSTSEILDQINAIQSQINNLQGQLPATPTTPTTTTTPTSWCHTFTIDLKYGDRKTEVKELQTVLAKEGLFTQTITDYFGEYTASAVVGFQEKYRSEILTPRGFAYGTGFFGGATRTKMNELYKCTAGQVTQPTTPTTPTTPTPTTPTTPSTPTTPTVSDANYKCPDLNGDNKVDVLDLVIVSGGYNTCIGNAKYDARGDVNGDNCLNDIDLNYIKKYFGKLPKDITQCQTSSTTQPTTVSDANYKCPDLNGDKKIDLMDLIVVSNGYGACTGSTKYDARGDFNSDGCLNDTDLNYIRKYYGKLIETVTQCQTSSTTQPTTPTTPTPTTPTTPSTPTTPTVSDANYKCPDLNGDKKIDLLDLVIVSNNYNTCVGDAKYDARGDVNGDNCLTDIELKYIQKYYGKLIETVTQCQTSSTTQPTTVSDANYKCPDLNGDKKIDLLDLVIVSYNYNTCVGDAKYDARGDVNGDNCLNDTDLKYIQKYYGKLIETVTQCQNASTSINALQKMTASIADAISQLLEGIKSLAK